MELRLIFHKGCPFVDYGEGLMLVDLGCPSSIAPKGSIGFDGIAVSVNRKNGPLNTDVLTDWFEHPVAGVLGSDLLMRSPLKIDYKTSHLITNYDGTVGDRIGVVSMGFAIVDLSIDGRNGQCIIDTGAQYSKLLPHIVKGKEVQECVEDCEWGEVGNRIHVVS